MNFRKRLERIEAELGVRQEKSYMIILSHVSRSRTEGETVHWEKDGKEFEHIIIWERGRHFRSFDSYSEEGKKFLLESGYKQVSGPTGRAQELLKTEKGGIINGAKVKVGKSRDSTGS